MLQLIRVKSLSPKVGCFSMHLFVVNLFLGPDTSWLLRVDALLGVLTLLCVATVIVAIARGVIGRFRSRKRDVIHCASTTTLTQLGIAVSDDDEQPDEKDLHPGQIPSKKAKDTTHSQ